MFDLGSGFVVLCLLTFAGFVWIGLGGAGCKAGTGKFLRIPSGSVRKLPP